MSKATPTRWPNIEALIINRGDITVGSIGSIPCVATAADSDQQLALLVRRPRETLETLITRLDEAIRSAWEDDEFIDEVNP